MLVVIVVSTKAGKKQKEMNERKLEDLRNLSPEEVEKKYQPAQKKISKMIGLAVFLPILATAIVIIFSVGGCSSDAKTPVLVIEEDGKKYVYHRVRFFLENSIKRDEFIDVSNHSKIDIYPLKEGVFVDPYDIEPFAAFATDQFEFIEYDQGSHAGFFVQSDSMLYSSESKPIPTDKIGKSSTLETIIISDGEKELKIEYEFDGIKRHPVRNCEIKSVWTMSNPYPGKTVGNYVDRLLVNATEVMRYFNPNAKMELVDDGEILLLSFEE